MTVKKKNQLAFSVYCACNFRNCTSKLGFCFCVFVVSGSTLTAWGLTDSIFLTYICVNVANPGK